MTKMLIMEKYLQKSLSNYKHCLLRNSYMQLKNSVVINNVGVTITKRYMGKMTGPKEVGHAAKILNALAKPPVLSKQQTENVTDVVNLKKDSKIPDKTIINIESKIEPSSEKAVQDFSHMPKTLVEKIQETNPHGINFFKNTVSSIINNKIPKEEKKEDVDFNKTNTVKEENLVTFKPYSLTGLNGFPLEWKNPSGPFREIYIKNFLMLFTKVLYTIGKNEMYTTEAVFQNIGELFKSIVPLLHNVVDYKQFKDIFLNKYMSSLQHIIVSFYKNKRFKIDYFKEFFSNKVDYNMYKNGNILNLIEAYVFLKTLSPLLDSASFASVNADSNLLEEKASIFGYDQKESQKQAGQKNVDWVGTKCITNEKGVTELVAFYKDTKMYSSNATTGRLVLIPEFFYNEKNIKAYFSRTIEGLQQTMITKNLILNKEFIKLLNTLEEKKHEILRDMIIYKKDIIKNFINEEDVERLKKYMEEYNKIIAISMEEPKIYEHLNWGMSVDMGRQEDFAKFYDQGFKKNIEHEIKNITEEEFEALHRTVITPQNEVIVQEVTERVISYFPEQIRENVRLAIEYANTP